MLLPLSLIDLEVIKRPPQEGGGTLPRR